MSFVCTSSMNTITWNVRELKLVTLRIEFISEEVRARCLGGGVVAVGRKKFRDTEG